MTSLWKTIIWLHTLVNSSFAEKREEKRESFVRHREERKKRFFFDIFFYLKTLSLVSRRSPLIGKAWRSKRTEEKIFGYENQET